MGKLRKFEDRPVGEWDRAGRWFPCEDEEHAACCNGIRTPSRAFGKSLWKHCQTRRHYETLCAEKGVVPELPEIKKTKRVVDEQKGYKALVILSGFNGGLRSNWEVKNCVDFPVKWKVGKWFRQKISPSMRGVIQNGAHPKSGYFYYNNIEDCHEYMRVYGVKGCYYQIFEITARNTLSFRGKNVCSGIRLDQAIHDGEIFKVKREEEVE